MQHEIEELDRAGLRKFGITTGIIFGVLFGLILPFLFSYSLPLWPAIVAGVLIVWALILPNALKPVYKGWMRIGLVLGWINTRIILGVLFLAIFFPIALALKCLQKDPMNRKLSAELDTYRSACHPQDRDHFERPY